MNEKDFIVLLAGGVGAAKFIDGMAQIIDQSRMKIIVNTGDDIELFGLRICPDLDIVTYTLAGLVDKTKGWGFKDESFNCLSILEQYYDLNWFNAGDKDLATHIYRTDLLRQGFTKAEATKKICKKLGVEAEIIPMCNQDVPTYIETPKGEIDFEEYYIKEQCKPKVLDIKLKGIERASPVKGVLKLFDTAKKIIICPSNPIVSIGTILSVPGVKKGLNKVREKVFGISPIIEGATVKGPADKLMKWKGLEASCLGVAEYYQDLLDHFIIDIRDKEYKERIEEELEINTYTFDTLMVNMTKKKELAQFVLDL